MSAQRGPGHPPPADGDAGADELVAHLRRRPGDVLERAGASDATSFERAFLLLAPGHTWTAPLGGATDGVVARLESSERASAVDRRWREHRRGLGAVERSGSSVVVRRGVPDHLVKVGDAEALDLLLAREPGLGVELVATLPPSSVVAPAVVEHGAAPEPRVPAVLSHPGASCRRYDGGVLLTRTALAHHGRSVLPESFRWFLDTDPAVSGLRDTGNGTGRLEPTAYDDARSAPPDAGQDEHLAGSFYHFGYENPGHFGHLMTEALSRLWAWPEAKRADPGLKVLCRHHPRRHRPGRAALERTLLIAFGVAPEDLVWTGGRTHVDTLVGCTPLWHNTVPLSAHVAIRDTWQRLGDGLRDRAGDAARVERVFVTRRAAGHNRTCHNVGEVERLAEEEGYTVVEPERLSLPDQAALFGGARVVAGLGGAGMFNTALATRLEKIVVLNHTGYHARNEHLVAAVLGAESETFWSEPDMLPRHERDYRAHQSAWSVDLGRHEAGIRRALRTA